MLINSLSLKNFKCFEELDVKFAPITLLTGANSSGKSSLINAILAVLQTDEFPFYLSINGKYINLGGFEEIVFGKDINKNISIELSLRSRKFVELNYATGWKNDDNGLPIIQNLELKNKLLELFINIEDNNYLVNLSLFRQSEAREIPVGYILNSLKGRLKYEYIISVDGNLIFANNRFASADKMIRNFLLPVLDAFRDYSRSFAINGIMGGVGVFSNGLQLNSFNYIGSFRQQPERTYYRKARAQAKTDTDGNSYIDQIIEWEETNSEKFKQLIAVMQQIELFNQIQSNQLKGGRFELAVKTTEKSHFSALTDVGFGISQFLPIIVADLQLSNESCLAISQPEIHLHPKIQAQFGDYLANQIKKTQKQYIVETHSEYLLNRIRLLLVTGELKPEDVRVLYFENNGIKSTVHDVEFATDGQVKGAPQGFFDTYGIDIMNIAMSAIG